MSYLKYEKIEIIFIYGEACQYLREATRIYQKGFPDYISRSTYANIIKIFRKIDNVERNV